MKYVANHETNFHSRSYGYTAGLLQASIGMSIEVFNIFYLLKSTTYINIFWGYLSLFFLTMFDDVFYTALKAEPLKKLVEEKPYNEIIQIEVTSNHRSHPADAKTSINEDKVIDAINED